MPRRSSRIQVLPFFFLSLHPFLFIFDCKQSDRQRAKRDTSVPQVFFFSYFQRRPFLKALGGGSLSPRLVPGIRQAVMDGLINVRDNE